MHYVYLLQSEVDKTFYIGMTNDLSQRLEKHNAGQVSYTSRKIPWKLIYIEGYLSIDLAAEREQQLKRFSSAYYALMKRLKLRT